MKRKKPSSLPPSKAKASPGRMLYTAFLTMSLSGLFCLPASAAGTTIWTKASEIMQDVYTQILSISTIAAIVTAASPGLG